MNIIIMDPDHYIKNGLSAYLKCSGINIMATSNLSDLTIILNNTAADVVVMELFSREDGVFSCIEFIRLFHTFWPNVRLVVYTQIRNKEAIKLLISVTGINDIILKHDTLDKLKRCVFPQQVRTIKHFAEAL